MDEDAKADARRATELDRRRPPREGRTTQSETAKPDEAEHEPEQHGTIVGVNGNMITVAFDGAVSQNEVGYARLGDLRLMCEVVRVRGNRADMQVFEDTTGLAVGDTVEFTRRPALRRARARAC